MLPQQTLGQQDFLNLLVAQLQAQDPLNPQSNTDFIAQMATFSQLSATQQVQTDLSTMSGQQQLLQANDLIGRSVTLTSTDGTTALNGTVAGVLMANGVPSIVVNGQAYDLSQVVSIAPAPTNTQP